MSLFWRAVILGWISSDSASFFDRLNRLEWYGDYLHSWVQNLDIVPHQHVLDVGCGPGNLVSMLTTSNILATGVDQSKAMISLAKTNNPKVSFEIDNALELSKINVEFDFVIAASLINIISDPRLLMLKMVEKCREGGIVSVLFPTPQFSHEVENIVEKKRLRGFSAEALRAWGGLPPKMRGEEVASIFEEVGLKSVQIHNFFDSGIVSVTGRKSNE